MYVCHCLANENRRRWMDPLTHRQTLPWLWTTGHVNLVMMCSKSICPPSSPALFFSILLNIVFGLVNGRDTCLCLFLLMGCVGPEWYWREKITCEGAIDKKRKRDREQERRKKDRQRDRGKEWQFVRVKQSVRQKDTHAQKHIREQYANQLCHTRMLRVLCDALSVCENVMLRFLRDVREEGTAYAVVRFNAEFARCWRKRERMMSE